jgi:hypothetical protein
MTKKSKALTPENPALAQPIFVDDENGKLFKDRSREIAYHKIE